MKKKEKIFSRLNLNMKDYNEELEEVLDKKEFKEEVQNLILSMFYKIENSYKDYHQVKKEMPEKDEFIQNLISSIEKYCNNIELIKPRGKKNEIEYKINKKKGEIKCFPNEVTLLYCVTKLINYDIKSADFKEIAITEMLEIGKSLNYQEVIRDFNGWSWTDSILSTKELQYNLLYQNLILLIGDEKIEKLYECEDKLSELKKVLEKNYKSDLVEKFLEDIAEISVLLKTNKDKRYKNKLINYFEPYVKELEQLSDKEQLIEYITKQKKKNINEIKKIDKLINNISELKNDFEERNKNLPKNKKIFSISSLEEIYVKQRADLLEQMKEYNKLVEPREYIKKKEELDKKTRFYRNLKINEEKENIIDIKIIELQEVFLKLFEKNINKCQEKKEIICLIYTFRYYWILNYKKDCKIKDSTKLKKILQQIFNKLVHKAEHLKAIETISDNTSCNIKIFEKILEGKIITLESIILQIANKGGKFNIKYFDGNTLEDEIELKSEKLNIKKKKIKMFF